MFDFDTEPDFAGTLSKKWEFRRELCGREDVIPMWIADMDFQTAPAVTAALERRAAAGIYGYAGVPQSYGEAVVQWYEQKHGWSIAPESIVQVTGIVPALHIAAEAFSDEGDAVLLQTPVYHPFYRVARKMRRRIVENPLVRSDDGYAVDFADLERKLQQERPKLFFLCNPQNPLGKVFSRGELLRIGRLCGQYGTIVVADEIHSDIVYREARHVPYGTLPEELTQQAVICTAPSKTFNIAGLRNSNIVIPSARLREAFLGAKEYFGYPGTGPFPLIACEAAYRQGGEWQAAVMEYIEANRDFALEFLQRELPEATAHRPQGTYFLWLDCRSLGMGTKELEAFLLEKARVWFNQGHIFGRAGEGFVRMNIACPRRTLERALQQMKSAIQGRA